VTNVRRFASKFSREAAAHSPKWKEIFPAVVDFATAYHDLGKLDDIFQDILGRNRKNKEGFNHVDAGTAYLVGQKRGEAALCCYAHHIGLPSMPEEKAKHDHGRFLRDEGSLERLDQLALERTNTLLDSYLAQHHAIVSPQTTGPSVLFTGLTRRLALSCLVDGDHSDTAQHYQQERELDGYPLRAAERLQALDRFVEALKPRQPAESPREQERLRLRQGIYLACRERDLLPSERIVSCDSPVGTGKTTAVMAHLLKVAADRRLRRIFVVLPFTNIIDQSVDVYRRALTLPGEDPAAVVAAHHHRVEFKGESWRDIRQFTQRWEAPIVVTTAVQFFETLGAKQTVALRKLHQVPGAAIFVDEAHTAMPAALWPQEWRWLRELCDDWNCHLVLASGSLSQFWTLPDFVPTEEQRPVPELVSDELRKDAAHFETTRVWLKTCPSKLSLPELVSLIKEKPGPRLVILNTVQSAAILAHHLRYKQGWGLNVEHLSTALCPADREITLRRIKENLLSRWENWALIATSCVEAGVDFSFRTAFRESCALNNLLQTAGRVSRGGEYLEAEVWDFQHDESGFLSLHPQFKTSRKVLAALFTEHVENLGPQHCTEALRRELNGGCGATESLAEQLLAAERHEDYPLVAKLCRVITADTHTVLVNQDLISRFLTADPQQFPSPREIMRYSVQVWSNKLANLPTTCPLGFKDDLVGIQPDSYDGFLGYMKGLIPLLEAQLEGGFVL
jgi:CRISPR-associated endonuclease/helicase Cas3